MRTLLLSSAVLVAAAAAGAGAVACGTPAKPAEMPAPLDAGGSGAAPTSAEAGAAVAPALTWQDVESTACAVRARMLGAPKESVQTITTDSGPAKLTMLMYEANDGASAMGIMCSEVHALKTSKASSDHILDGSRDGMIKNVRGTLVNERPFTFSGHPAREVLVRTKTQDVHARIVFMRPKGKILTLIAVGLDETTARTFLDSMALFK